MTARHKAKIETPHGPRTCFEARIRREGKEDLVARFGGIPLLRDKNKVITDPAPVPVPAPRTPQGAGPPAPHAQVRTVRARRHGGCPPGRQARQARETRTRPARVGSQDGQDAAQDPGGLPGPATRPSTQPLSRTRRSRWRARCGESRPAGSEEGCAEKARLRLKRTRDLAAQPILSTNRLKLPRPTCTPTWRSRNAPSPACTRPAGHPDATAHPTASSPTSRPSDQALRLCRPSALPEARTSANARRAA